MHPRPIRHRRVRRTDFDAVCAILAACDLPVPEADRAGLRRFRRLVADLGADFYLACIDERPVGVVHVTYSRHLLYGPVARLALLAVAPEDRRRGVGRALAAFAGDRARRRGCGRLGWDGAAASDHAAAFLAALGWRGGAEQFVIDLPNRGE